MSRCPQCYGVGVDGLGSPCRTCLGWRYVAPGTNAEFGGPSGDPDDVSQNWHKTNPETGGEQVKTFTVDVWYQDQMSIEARSVKEAERKATQEASRRYFEPGDFGVSAVELPRIVIPAPEDGGAGK